MTALVSIKQVVKGYTRGLQRVEVLHSIDLTVERGEFLAHGCQSRIDNVIA